MFTAVTVLLVVVFLTATLDDGAQSPAHLKHCSHCPRVWSGFQPRRNDVRGDDDRPMQLPPSRAMAWLTTPININTFVEA